jgi:multiple sugar transport system ATP-binding protein
MATIRLSEVSFTRGQARKGGSLGRVSTLILGSARAFELRRFTLTVPHGKTMVILGPSGCGKSTLLRIVAGLERPESGRVLFDGKDVSDIRPGNRRIGYLFQTYALYPHLTSRENITSYFFFRRKSPEMNRLREHIFQRTSEMLDVDISYLLERKPTSLSGGEQQRVALGRCITREPELFLLDEPFSNLDAKLRTRYRVHLKTLLREFAITTLYVTHDQQEAVLLGDLVAVMSLRSEGDRNVGALEQVGPVRELYEHPANRFVADFLNLQGDVAAISFLPGAHLSPHLSDCTVGVRPEDVEILAGEGEGLPAVVQEVGEDALRQYRIVTLRVGPDALVAKVLPGGPGQPGETVRLHFRTYHLFDATTGETVHHGEAARALLG